MPVMLAQRLRTSNNSELIRLAQGGQIQGKITKEQIKGVLAAIARQTTRETKIVRK